MEWLYPADTAVTSLATCTGVKRVSLVPSPSWPSALYPIAQRVLSDFKNMERAFPADTAVTSLATCTEVERFSVVPSPSWPRLLRPVAQRVLSDFKNMEWLCPTATAVTSFATCTAPRISVCAGARKLLQEAKTSPRARTGANFSDFFMLNTVPRLLQLARGSRCVSVCGQVHVLVVAQQSSSLSYSAMTISNRNSSVC